MLFEFPLDWESELQRLLGKYEIVVPSSIVQELTHLADQQGGARRSYAQAALKLIRRFSVVEVDESQADDSLLELATRVKGMVVTNDRELRRRLRERSLPVIFFRGKNQLALE